jgi:hypothetical protein
MLSKDEILKKKGKSVEQLDLVKDIDFDSQKNKKRWLLVLFLILTIGSSVCLSVYREYREGKLIINFSVPRLPNLPVNLSTDKNVWQICLFNKNNNSLLYSQNCQQSEIPNITINNNIDLIKSSLPNGLIINETISTSSPEINYFSTISSPKFNYLLTIKIFGSFPLEKSISNIPNLASSLYWRYAQQR